MLWIIFLIVMFDLTVWAAIGFSEGSKGVKRGQEAFTWQ